MKMQHFAAALALMLCGCATTQVPVEEKEENPEALLAAGDARGALRLYLAARDRATTQEERRKAVLGASLAFQRSGDNTAALSVLMPAPLAVLSETDAQVCARIGELHLRKGSAEDATPWLERAVAWKEGTPVWRPSALFNLGKCALVLGLANRAEECFAEAEKLFRASGDENAAEKCARLVAAVKK